MSSAISASIGAIDSREAEELKFFLSSLTAPDIPGVAERCERADA
jgi:hypothetical protein